MKDGMKMGTSFDNACPEQSRRAQDDSHGVMVSLSNHDRQLEGIFG